MSIKQLRGTLLILLLALVSISSYADTYLKREFRSAWVATVWNLDWPTAKGASAAVQAKQKAELISMIESFKGANINTFCFQVRSMCDAMYKSSYEPWSSYLVGTRGDEPGWDPLQFAVEECHKRGMECHAWVNPYRYSTGTVWNTAQDKELINNNRLLTYESITILNPGLEFTRKRIVDVCKEILINYDVDGLIFDDYFYPSGIISTADAGDYNLWKNSGTTLSFADWRRGNVNLMISDVYNMIKEVKPWAKFGISPAGVAGTSSTSASKYGVTPCPVGSDWQYNGIFSDPLAWLSEGTIDYISPQLYWGVNHTSNPFGPLTKWWSYVANKFGRHHYASHSISSFATNNTTTNWKDTSDQIQLSRDHNKDKAPGAIFYSASYIFGPKKSGFGDYVSQKKFQKPVISPAMEWKEKTNYAKVSSLTKSGSTLSWASVSGGGIKYSIYAIPVAMTKADAMSTEFTGLKSDYLLGLSYTNSYALPAAYSNGYWYAVCIVDGHSNEFESATINEPGAPAEIVTLTSPINNKVINSISKFEWSSAVNAKYTIQVSVSDMFSTIAYEKKDITTNSVDLDLAALTTSIKFYWRVKTTQTGKYDSMSESASFTIKERENVAASTLLSVANNTIVTEELILRCTKVDASEHLLLVSPTSDFSNISFSTSTWDENGSELSVIVPSVSIINGKYYWKVVTKKTGYNDNQSDVWTFVFEGNIEDPDEPGYVIKQDVDAYIKVNDMVLENKWMRSVKSDYENIAFESNGLLNRGLCVSGNIIYISGRSDNSASASCYLNKYNANTGAYIGKLQLSNDATVSYYPCNDVFKDSKGNICISNLTLNISSTPLKIFSIDPVSGQATARATCSGGTAIAAGRVDHCAVLGDVVSGNFSVLAPIASGTQVIKWVYINGELKSTNVCDIKGFYPATVTHSGIATRVIPINETSFYLIGGNIPLTRYSFTTGAIEQSFAANATAAPTSYNCNGGTSFVHENVNYMVYPYSDHTDAIGFRYNMVSTDAQYTFASMSKMWTFPKAGLGTINSTTLSAIVDYEQQVVDENNITNIYIYVPGNGLAAYTFSKDPNTSIIDGELSEIEITVSQKSIYLNIVVDAIEVYSISGGLIATQLNAQNMTLDTSDGVYIIKVKNGDNIIIKKAILK